MRAKRGGVPAIGSSLLPRAEGLPPRPGGVHPVDYGCCDGKFITNVKFKGRFADYVKFPLSSKGFRIVFRVTVRSALGTRAVKYWVEAR